MDRWEPPAPTADPPRSARGRRGRIPRIPVDYRAPRTGEWFAVFGRVAVGTLLGVPLLAPLSPSGWTATALAGLALLAGGAVIGARAGFLLWGRVWLVDLASYGLLAPLLVLANFVGSGTHDALPAETSAYLQTVGIVAVVGTGLRLLAGRLARGEPSLVGVLLLPGALQVPGLAAAAADYRDETVAAILAAGWVAAGAATGVVLTLPGRDRWLVPFLTFVGATLVAVAVGPGEAALAGVRPPVTSVQPLLVAGAAASLVPWRALMTRGDRRRRRAASPRRARSRDAVVARDDAGGA